MTHHENQAAPIAAEDARVSMVRIAQTVKRTRSARPRTRSRAPGAASEAGTAEGSFIGVSPDRICPESRVPSPGSGLHPRPETSDRRRKLLRDRDLTESQASRPDGRDRLLGLRR